MDTITKQVNADQAAGLIPAVTDSFVEASLVPMMATPAVTVATRVATRTVTRRNVTRTQRR